MLAKQQTIPVTLEITEAEFFRTMRALRGFIDEHRGSLRVVNVDLDEALGDIRDVLGNGDGDEEGEPPHAPKHEMVPLSQVTRTPPSPPRAYAPPRAPAKPAPPAENGPRLTALDVILRALIREGRPLHRSVLAQEIVKHKFANSVDGHINRGMTLKFLRRVEEGSGTYEITARGRQEMAAA